MTNIAKKFDIIDVVSLTAIAFLGVCLLLGGAFLLGNPDIKGNDLAAGMATMAGGAFTLAYVFGKATRRI